MSAIIFDNKFLFDHGVTEGKLKEAIAIIKDNNMDGESFLNKVIALQRTDLLKMLIDNGTKTYPKHLNLAKSLDIKEIIEILDKCRNYKDAYELVYFCYELGFIPCNDFQKNLMHGERFDKIKLVKYHDDLVNSNVIDYIKTNFSLRIFYTYTDENKYKKYRCTYKGFRLDLKLVNLKEIIHSHDKQITN